MLQKTSIFEKLGLTKTYKKLEIEPGVYYATFNGRLLASTIDNILCLLVLAPFVNVIAAIVSRVDQSACTGAVARVANGVEQFGLLFEHCFNAAWAINNIVQIVILAAIILGFWFSKGATPGKMAMRMHIVDADTLAEPSRRQYYVRFLGYFVSMFVFGLGFLAIAWDKRKQGWHDKIAGTLVIVDKRKKEKAGEGKPDAAA